MKIELGISTFGETTPLRKTGRPISHAERLQNLVEEIELADKVGQNKRCRCQTDN